MTALPPPFAVHIADGILTVPWQASGFAVLAVGLLVSLFRIDEREIPRVGVLTAAFFVASQVHIPFGPISVHLLLNGLVGVILRHRAPPAVAVGLTLQALLFAHGGWLALGVNFSVLAVPAVLAGVAYRAACGKLSPLVAGVLVGAGTAALTVLLNAAVLYFGSIDPKGFIAGVSLVAHLPVIGIEAVLVGSAARVLATAKPEWLGAAPKPA